MKRISKIFSLIMLLVSLSIVCGCEKNNNDTKIDKNKQQTILYDGNKLKAEFKIDKKIDARISTENDDLRTTREKAIIITEDFKIGIEENDDLSFNKYSGDFGKYKKEHKKNTDYKKAKLSDLDAFTQYYGAYIRYEAYLKVDDNYILKLNIYSTKDTEEDVKKQFESQVVQDILNNISVEAK